MSYNLEAINGVGAEAELAETRRRNQMERAASSVAVREALQQVASPAGVVRPHDSRAIHSGEHPVVRVESPAETDHSDTTEV